MTKLTLLLVLLILTGCQSIPEGMVTRPKDVTRIGMAVEIRPDKIDEYKQLHAECWPEVLAALKECHLRNFSIYLGEPEPGKFYLFGYLEYWGNDIEADMAKTKTYEINHKWWELTNACQIKLPNNHSDEIWMGMEEVFHSD